MASNSKNHKNIPGKHNPVKQKPSASKTAAARQKNSGRNLWEALDVFFSKHLKSVMIICLIAMVILGAFLFDVKISTGGDDSHYIEMANDFLKGRAFPSWHGPLYSIFLSLPMLFFGVNVIWLKMFSFLFIIAQFLLFYHTFKRHVSSTVMALIMIILAVNSTILYFASQTYSEAMFMFLQALIIYIFLNIYLNFGSEKPLTLKQEAPQWLVLGFFVFLASLTRNIGIVALVAMVLFLLMEKRFRGAVMLVLSYVIFLIPFRIYKSLVWKAGISQGPDQIYEILRKNPYNHAMGTENFGGMVDRFLINTNSYLSKHFMISLGLHDPVSTEKSWLITMIIIGLCLIALYFAFRRSKVMLFICIYLAGSMAATFIALHQSWDQMRMVVIYFPMLLLLMTWGIQQLSSDKRFTFAGVVFIVLLILVFFKTFDQTTDKITVNKKVLSRNLKGNLYYGFTPDWQNYLKMSEWVSKNIPANEMVAARKPSMSYIYSKGREFYGMYKFPSETPEELLNGIRKRTGELYVFPSKEIKSTWPVQLQWRVKQSTVACVVEGNDVYGVYEFKGPDGNEVINSLNQNNVKPFSVDSILKRVKVSSQQCFAVSPDSLLNTLRRNNVKYIIVANLRANPNMNTGNIINNIQRYLYFVEQKYPGILNMVHQIGSNEEEPAWLYQLNYKVYGL